MLLAQLAAKNIKQVEGHSSRPKTRTLDDEGWVHMRISAFRRNPGVRVFFTLSLLAARSYTPNCWCCRPCIWKAAEVPVCRARTPLLWALAHSLARMLSLRSCEPSIRRPWRHRLRAFGVVQLGSSSAVGLAAEHL
jgi:hypothetical protein